MIDIKTPPQSEPVTLAEAKDHLRIDTDAHDNRLEALISAAREHAERYLGRSIGEQTIVLSMERFAPTIALPRPPITAVESIAYDDRDGITETLDADEYRLTGETVISTYRDRSWPATDGRPGSVRITYTAGYGATPEPIKQAVLMMVERLFDRHEVNYDATLARVADMLLWPYRQVAV